MKAVWLDRAPSLLPLIVNAGVYKINIRTTVSNDSLDTIVFSSLRIYAVCDRSNVLGIAVWALCMISVATNMVCAFDIPSFPASDSLRQVRYEREPNGRQQQLRSPGKGVTVPSASRRRSESNPCVSLPLFARRGI